MIVADSFRSGSAQRVALVTGASGGIGEQIVVALAAQGYLVVAQYRSDGSAERLREIDPLRVEPMRVDLADPIDTARWVELVDQRFPAIECLVHAAAPPIVAQPALEVNDADFLEHLQVQTAAFAALTRALLPMMQRQQRGVIVGVLSAVVEPSRPKMWWPYTTAKFASLGLLSGLSTDVEGSGVRVVGVLPAGVLGALSKNAGLSQERLLSPREVAALVARMVSEPQAFPNGTFAKLDLSGISVGRMAFVANPITSA